MDACEIVKDCHLTGEPKLLEARLNIKELAGFLYYFISVEVSALPTGCTGCTKSQLPCLNFERIYLEYYNRYNGKIKIYSRFGYGKSIALGFSSISIVILNIYMFKVQTVDRTFEAPCTSISVSVVE